MNKQRGHRAPIVAILVLAGALGFAGIADGQAAPDAAKAPNAMPSPTIESPGQFLQVGFDDLMTLLVQPRHLKLYYAGTQRNWELAAAQVRDLRSALGRIASSFPSYQGIGVDEALWTFVAPKLQAMDRAIAAADPKQFVAAYAGLTAACNACHVYMEHPFFVIKVPESGTDVAYPDQEFRGAR